jgi:hypothetical protein
MLPPLLPLCLQRKHFLFFNPCLLLAKEACLFEAIFININKNNNQNEARAKVKKTKMPPLRGGTRGGSKSKNFFYGV